MSAPVNPHDYPALVGEVVTDAHAAICRDRGHATHTINGTDSGVCPRCGAVTIDDVRAGRRAKERFDARAAGMAQARRKELANPSPPLTDTQREQLRRALWAPAAPKPENGR